MGGRGASSASNNYLIALNKGKIVKINQKGNYEATEFRIKDNELQFKSKEISGTEFIKHPTMNKTDLLNHIKRLEKKGFKITIQ